MKQNAYFFKLVFLDNYRKDPIDRLQQRSDVNQYVPPQLYMKTLYHIPVYAYELLATSDKLPKLALTLHNHELLVVVPSTRLCDHAVTTNPTKHQQFHALTYLY